MDELKNSIPKTTNDITHNSDSGSIELNVYLEELKNSVANGKELLANAISTISSVYTRNTDTFTTKVLINTIIYNILLSIINIIIL